MTMLNTCPVSSGSGGQLLETGHCLLATSLGTIPGARAKSFSDALTLTCTPLTPDPHATMLALVLSRGSCTLFYLKKAQD